MIENNKITKPNDWFVANALNPNASLDDFKSMALQPENTELQSQEYYKSQPAVQNIFKDKKGGFDETAFNNYYNSLIKSYNSFSTEKYDLKNFTDNLLYSEYDYLTPIQPKIKPYKVGITKVFNPTSAKIGIEGFGTWSESALSIREVAQTQNVKSLNGKDLGFTPNDDSKSGLFDYVNDLFFGSGAKAVAQYTEDGTHLDLFTGENVKHKKGEYKYNELGKPYYETLDGATPVNRQLLSGWDTITVDGTTQDKFNFMSGDDKEKSFIGSTMRAAALMIPYAIPGLGQWYALSTAGLTTLEFAPQIAKMIGGFTAGEDFKSTDIYKWLNSAESTFKSLNATSVSDNSMEKMWTWENMLTLIPDVFMQLKQQRAIGDIPKMFKLTSADAKQLNRIAETRGTEQMTQVKNLWSDAKKLKDPGQEYTQKLVALLQQNDPELFQLYQGWVNTQNKIAKGLSIGYMTAASSGGVEEVVDQFGISARDGAWMKLGVLAAFWLEMNYFSFGDWQVNYAVGLDDAAKTLNKLTRQEGALLKEEMLKLPTAMGVEESINTNSQKAFLQSLKGISGSEFFKKGQELGSKIISKINDSEVLLAMSRESLEEMSEETFLDGAKVVYNIFSDLNLTETKDKKINWDNDETLQRYAMAGVGGAIGGVLFHANDAFTKPIRDGLLDTDFAKTSIEMFRNGNGNEVYRIIDKIRNSNAGFASKDLSFNTHEKTYENDQVKRTFLPANENRLSQNDVIANELTTQAKLIEKVIFQTKVPTDRQIQDIFQERTNSFIDIKEHSAIKDDIIKLTNESIKIYTELQAMNKELDPLKVDEKRKAELELELETKRKQIEAIGMEEAIGKYYAEAMFNMDKSLNRHYMPNKATKEDLANALHNSTYDQLSEYQKANIDEKVNSLSERERLNVAKVLFDKHAKLIAGNILPINEFFEQYKNIQTQLSKIEFDFKKERKDPNTEISEVIPQFAKKGIIEFLNNTKNVDRLLVIDPEKQSLQDNFQNYLNVLLDKVASVGVDNALGSITEDDYLLLKYLQEYLGDQKMTFHDYISESTLFESEIIDFLNAHLKRLGSEPATIGFDTWKQFEKNPKTLNEYSEIINEEYDPDNYQLDDYGLVTEFPDKLLYEFQLSKGDLRQLALQKQIDILNRIKELNLSKSYSYNQLESLIGRLDPKTNRILELIEAERTRLLEKPIEDYITDAELGSNSLKDIQKAKELLKQQMVVLYAYTNFSLDADTAIGYFPALNEYNKHNRIQVTYDQISAQNARPLQEYVRYVYKRLTYLEQLSDKNINSKIPNKEKSEVVMTVLQFKKFWDNFLKIDAFKELKEELNKDEEFRVFFGTQLADENWKDYLSAFKPSDISLVLEKVYQAEHKIFEAISELKDKEDFIKNFLTVFVNEDAFAQEIQDEKATTYSKDSKNLTYLDQLFYAISILTGDSYKFLDDYNQIMTAEPLKYAMFGDQQNALKVIHHLLQSTYSNAFGNSNIITAQDLIIQVKQKLMSSKIELFQDEEIYLNNILSIYGIQGTGKTEAVLDSLSKMLQKHNLNIVATADKENIAEKVLNSVTSNKIVNVKTQNLNTLLETIFGKDNYNNLKTKLKQPISTDGVQILKSVENGEYPQLNPNNEIIIQILNNIDKVVNSHLKLGDDVINLIFIDESTQIDLVTINLLNKFINKYNEAHKDTPLSIITTGDWRQPGAVQTNIKDNKEVLYNSNQQQVFNIHAIDLNSSIRAENNCKLINSRNLQIMVEQEPKSDSPSPSTNKLSLKYYDDEKVFTGEKSVDFSNNITSHEKLLTRLITLAGEQKKVAIILEEDNQDLKALQEKYKIDTYTKDNMNGIEYDYVLVDLDLSKFKSNFGVYLRYLNGALTRSKKGTYINESAYKVFPTFEIEEIKDKRNFEVTLPPQKIKDYKNKRIRLINTIQNKLLNKVLVEPTEEPYVKEEKVSKSDNRVFNLGGLSTGPKTIDSKDLIRQLNTKDDNLTFKGYSQIQVNHRFGNEDSKVDPSDRKLNNYKNKDKNIQIITSFAKKLFIENLYSDNPKEQKELNLELLNYITTNINKYVNSIDLVFYERESDEGTHKKVSMDFDESIDGKYSADTVMVFALRFEINGTYEYLPLGAQLDEMKDFLRKNTKADDLFNNGEDFVLNKNKMLQFLTPNLSLRIDGETKVSIEDLEKRFVVSKMYITSKDVQDVLGDKFHLANGAEFILVSTDHVNINQNNIFSQFKQELAQGLVNAEKKKQNTSDVKSIMGLSNSSIKLVAVDRVGLAFKEWLSIMRQNRKKGNSTTIRALGDSFVSARLFNVLATQYSKLVTKLQKQNETLEDPKKITSLTDQEIAFSLYFANILNILRITAPQKKDSEILNILKSKSTDSKKLLHDLETYLLKNETDGLFVDNHLFIYLLQVALSGGSVISPDKSSKITLIKHELISENEDQIVDYIDDVLKDSGQFKKGIFYTAQVSKGDEPQGEFQYVQNIDVDSKKYFEVSDVYLSDFHLPINDDLFDKKIPDPDPDPDPDSDEDENIQLKLLEEVQILIKEKGYDLDEKSRNKLETFVNIDYTDANPKEIFIFAFNDQKMLTTDRKLLRLILENENFQFVEEVLLEEDVQDFLEYIEKNHETFYNSQIEDNKTMQDLFMEYFKSDDPGKREDLEVIILTKLMNQPQELIDKFENLKNCPTPIDNSMGMSYL